MRERVRERVNVCWRGKEKKLSVFPLSCGELSIVTGAESGLLIPHLSRGRNLISRREEEEKKRKTVETASQDCFITAIPAAYLEIEN